MKCANSLKTQWQHALSTYSTLQTNQPQSAGNKILPIKTVFETIHLNASVFRFALHILHKKKKEKEINQLLPSILYFDSLQGLEFSSMQKNEY